MADVTDNGAGSPALGNFSSGSASEAMIKAATEASSASPEPAGAAAGKPLTPAGVAAPDPKPAAIGQTETVVPPTPAPAIAEAPEARIQAAVKNARAEFAWTKGLNPQEVTEAVQFLRDLRADPKAFVSRVTGEMKASGLVEEPEEALPEPDLQTEDGKTKAYSATAVTKLVTLAVAKAIKEVRGEIKPVLDQRASEAITTKARGVALSAIEEGRSWLHFKEHESDIADVMAAMDPALKRELGPHRVMQRAYNQVLQEKVLPAQQAAAEAKVRESFEKKANTSIGSAHPSDNGGGGGKKPELTGVESLARYMERMAAQATT